MKKIILLLLLVGVSACGKVYFTQWTGGNPYYNVGVPVAIKNISGSPVTLKLNPVETQYGHLYNEETGDAQMAWQEISLPAVIIPSDQLPATSIPESGKLYNQRITGKMVYVHGLGTSSRPKIKTIDVNDNKQTPTGSMNDFNKKAYNHAGFAYPDINRQSFIHYLIIPGGHVVQVPEIIEYGGVVTVDQYIIHGDGHVTREDGLPCEKCAPPAGKTTASVGRNGNLVWL